MEAVSASAWPSMKKGLGTDCRMLTFCLGSASDGFTWAAACGRPIVATDVPGCREIARPGVNALLLGTLLYRSRLVPRALPVLGLIAGPLLIASVIATIFGGIKLGSPILAGLPVAAWELSLGVWLVVKGFRPTAITAGIDAAV